MNFAFWSTSKMFFGPAQHIFDMALFFFLIYFWPMSKEFWSNSIFFGQIKIRCWRIERQDKKIRFSQKCSRESSRICPLVMTNRIVWQALRNGKICPWIYRRFHKKASYRTAKSIYCGFGLPDFIFTVEVGKCEDVLFGE